MQQVLAFETDLLEYEDLFTGSVVVEPKVAEIVEGARAEIARVQEMGGAVAAVESGYMKGELVGSLAERRRRMESGEDVVVGVNRFETTEPNPLLADLDAAIKTVDPAVEDAAQEAVQKWRAERDQAPCDEALDAPARGRRHRREPDGRHPRLRPRRRHDGGVGRGAARGVRRVPGARPAWPRPAAAARPTRSLIDVRERVRATGEELGGRLRFLVGKPGLDGHSNGAEQIAVRARDAGFEVIYQGIRLTPAQIVAAAVEEDVHVVGLSVLSGSHLQVVPAVLRGPAGGRAGRRPGRGRRDHPRRRRRGGCASRAWPAVFTPKDFGLTEIMGSVVDVIREANGLDEKVPRAGMMASVGMTDGAPRVERDGDVVRITMTRAGASGTRCRAST